MSYDDIFKVAGNYEFDTVVKYVEDGRKINICDQYGHSLLKNFLDGYYDYADFPSSQEQEEMNQHKETDYKFWNCNLDEVRKTPLEKRGSNILKQLNWFFDHGADVNLCEMRNGMTETPLFVAVVNEDRFLVEYLLEHGADPKLWLCDEKMPYEDYDNWLIEHMDIQLIDVRGERAQNCLEIAALLARYGLDDFSGMCISIDKEKRIITANSFQPRF